MVVGKLAMKLRQREKSYLEDNSTQNSRHKVWHTELYTAIRKESRRSNRKMRNGGSEENLGDESPVNSRGNQSAQNAGIRARRRRNQDARIGTRRKVSDLRAARRNLLKCAPRPNFHETGRRDQISGHRGVEKPIPCTAACRTAGKTPKTVK